MHGHMLDLQRYKATSGKRNFTERIKAPFFEGRFDNRDNVRAPIQFPAPIQCLVDQIQVQKPILIVATDQIPNHT